MNYRMLITARLILGVGVLLLASSGCNDDSSTSPPLYTLNDVEEALRVAGIEVIRQRRGPFRVGTDEPPFCEEVHSSDFRTSVVVCRDRGSDIMLVRAPPEKGTTRTFDSADAALVYLSSNRPPNVTPLLVIDEENVTITYIGRDAERVHEVARFIAELQEG
jgi:hypothetical protein